MLEKLGTRARAWAYVQGQNVLGGAGQALGEIDQDKEDHPRGKFADVRILGESIFVFMQ